MAPRPSTGAYPATPYPVPPGSRQPLPTPGYPVPGGPGYPVAPAPPPGSPYPGAPAGPSPAAGTYPAAGPVLHPAAFRPAAGSPAPHPGAFRPAAGNQALHPASPYATAVPGHVPAGPPLSPPPPRTGPRVLPRALRIVLDVLLLLVCGFFALGTAAVQTTDMNVGWVLVACLGALAVTPILLWRRSRPVMATVVAACVTLVLPIDNLAVLICLPWVIARRPARTAWWVGALATFAAVVALVRDAWRGPERSIFFIADQVTGERQPWPVLAYVAVGAFVLLVSIGTGLLRRSRGSVAQAESAQRQLRAELTTELSRQDERDLIARELHDTVAHHLSVVSLRASALEVTGDDAVQEAAQSVRTSTHQALEEMRDLIGVLRNGQASLTAGPGPGRTLTELPELITTARESGADVAANVFVSGGDSAPPVLTRAVYRIVQESLTNAIKHAPHQRIDLELRAGPGLGVHLRVSNPLPATPVAAPGSGTGLLGVRERVASVGGTVEAGAQGDRWVLTAHLPWPAED